MKRHITIFSTLMGIVLSTALSSCNKQHGKDDKTPTETEETIDVALPVVDSVVLHREYPGTLSAVNEVNLVARVNGSLVYADYEPGAIVEKGTVLYRIDDSQYRNDVNQAAAQLATARATHAYNIRNYQAMKKAIESDAVSQMDVIQAESAMKESEAAINNAQAVLSTARLNLGYCTVTAPFRGRVSKCAYSDGQYLAGAASPVTLGTIYDDSQLNAYFAIEDAQFLQMLNEARSNKKINYDSIPLLFSHKLPHTYTGRLDYLAPQIDTSTGTISIRAKVDNPYGELKSGQYVRVSLPYAIEPKAILVKDASISTDQQGKYVYVVDNDNKIVYTPIETGELVNDTMRIVSKGLTPESRYVTKALLKVRNGMEVKPRLTK